MGERGRGTRTHVVVLVALLAGLVTGLPAAASAAAPTESVAAGAACPTGRVRADAAVTRLHPGGCRLTGRRISHGPLTTRVPARGHGTVLTGLSKRGEWSLDVRTRRDGVVVVRTGSPTPRRTTGAAAPSNDSLAAATPLPVPWSVPGTTTEATADADDQAASAACQAADLNGISATDPSVWYSVTPTADVVLVSSIAVTAGSSPSAGPVSSIFTRDPAGVLVAVVCDVQPAQTPRLLAGHTYYLQVASFSGAIDFVTTGRPPSAAELPVNDGFASAALLPLDKEAEVGLYDRASLEPGEPAPPCGPAALGTVWFRVDPGAWRRLALTYAPYQETVTLWQGTALGSLTSVGCFAPQPGQNAPGDGAVPRWELPGHGPYYLQVALVDPAVDSARSFEMTSDDSCSGQCLPPCQLRDYKLESHVLPRAPWRWSFNIAGGLKGLTSKQVLQSVKAGAKIVTTSKNDCGLSDKVSAKSHYLGTSKAKASVCSTRRGDGRNVVAVVPRGGGSTLALTCYQLTQAAGSRKWRITESDMEVYADFRWTTDGDDPGCRDQQDLVGVMAHEVGHVFGLDHAGRSRAGNLTMFPIAPPACNGSASSLGLGDVLALRSLY